MKGLMISPLRQVLMYDQYLELAFSVFKSGLRAVTLNIKGPKSVNFLSMLMFCKDGEDIDIPILEFCLHSRRGIKLYSNTNWCIQYLWRKLYCSKVNK